MKSPRPVLPSVPAGCSTNAAGSNHCSGVPGDGVVAASAGGEARAVEADAGARDGDHCDRERLAGTKTVSGWPLPHRPIPDELPVAEQAPGHAADGLARTGRPRVRLTTQLCRVSKSDGPLL